MNIQYLGLETILIIIEYIYTMTSSEPVEDFLQVDLPIPGQNYVVLSFLSPEKILRKKELYLIKHFLKDTLTDASEVKRLIELLSDQKELSYNEVEDMFESYLLRKMKTIYQQYDEENDFQTSVRGVKLRGTYNTYKEADIRSKVLKRKDPNFETWIGQVGYWLPWEPRTDDNEVEEVFADNRLNNLMSKKKENTEEKEEVFDPATQAKMEAQRREQELNQLSKTYEDKLVEEKDSFESRTQAKKDAASKEANERKAFQKAQREEMETKEKTNRDKKGKKRKKKHSHSTKSTKSTQTSEEPTTTTNETTTETVDKRAEAETKIKELRDILDQREKKYEEVMAEQNQSNEISVNNDVVLNGPDIFDSPTSDPWMQKKLEEQSTVVTDTVEEENVNLDQVLKKIL